MRLRRSVVPYAEEAPWKAFALQVRADAFVEAVAVCRSRRTSIGGCEVCTIVCCVLIRLMGVGSLQRLG